MNAEEIKDYILREFRSSFLTGSYYFNGGIGNYADIDIVICRFIEPKFDDVMEFLASNHFVKDGDYNQSKKIYPSNYMDNPSITTYVNLIMVHPLEWHCWKYGTEIMSMLPSIPEEKMKRHALFENVRASVKMSLTEKHLGLDSILQDRRNTQNTQNA